MKRNFRIIAAVLAPALAVSCGENAGHIADRVFSLAREQVILMDARLAPNTSPRTFENGKAVDAGLKAWTSGFFPGSAWYVYEYTGDSRIKEVAERRTRELAALPGYNVGHDIGFMMIAGAAAAFCYIRAVINWNKK